MRCDLGEQLPARGEFDALVVLGGAAGPLDDERCPWLPAVRRLLVESAGGAFPSFNICLGGELLAAATGGRISRRSAPQVGVFGLRDTAQSAADAVFGALPAEFESVLWHQEQMSVPPGGVLLATGSGSPVQGFRVGEAWGTQFHPEVTPEIIRHWIAGVTKRRSFEAYAGTTEDDLLAQVVEAQDAMKQVGVPLAAAFVELVRSTMSA